MTGMMVGGIVWGVLGDKRGRLSVLFGSIILYSAANLLNAFVTSFEQYAVLRFLAGVGLAGELGAGITAIQGDSQGRVRAVLGADGREWRADVVVVGVGVLPNDELARDAGLECANGILVDEFCRTADPAIYAIGDCSNHPSLHYGRRIRLESVDNAVEQANTVAANLTGTVTRHDRVPWFWSDQYHHKMLIVGLSQDHDRQVLRGSPADAAFSVCYLRDGELIAVDTVNQPRDQITDCP